MKYSYIVFYSYKSPVNSGLGNVDVYTDKRIDSVDDVRDIEKKISIKHFDGKVHIIATNYKLLKVEK